MIHKGLFKRAAVSAGTQIEPQMLSFYDGYYKTLNARQ
jgi:hypothetical protein